MVLQYTKHPATCSTWNLGEGQIEENEYHNGFKVSIPYGKQETGTPFHSVFEMMSCSGSVLMYMCE